MNFEVERAEKIEEIVKREGPMFDSKIMKELNLSSSQFYRASKYLVETKPSEYIHKKSASGILGIYYIGKDEEIIPKSEICLKQTYEMGIEN